MTLYLVILIVLMCYLSVFVDACSRNIRVSEIHNNLYGQHSSVEYVWSGICGILRSVHQMYQLLGDGSLREVSIQRIECIVFVVHCSSLVQLLGKHSLNGLKCHLVKSRLLMIIIA